MSIFDYQNPIISQMRTNYIDKSESHQIVNSKVVLSELPDSFAKVQVSGIGVTWIETKNPSPSANEYYVDYTNGVVTHHSSREGIQPTYSFKAKGLQFYPASRVYVETDSNGDVTKTLGDIISEGEQAIVDLGLISETIDDAEAATQAAINATNTINTTNTNIQSAESGRVTAENTRNSQESTRQSQETTRKNQETSRVSAETSRVGAENARVTAESNRATTETSRVNAESSRSSAESSRVIAENGRSLAENARVSAESNRATAETTRVGNETTRQGKESDRLTAENNRVSAESARVTAENARVSAESNRISDESARDEAENIRDTAETNRVNAESSRVSAETARVNAESTRVTAESGRVSAEGSRTTAESNRASAETTRAGNETTRQNNESARVTAENSRVSVESARVTAENSRATAETSRASVESARVTAENTRVTNENARISAETTRSTNESTRQTNETTRQSQESNRQTNTTNAISNLNTAINTTKLNYKTPVATFADIATTYPSPQLGDAVQVLADNKYYRYDGSAWKHFNTINLAGAATSADIDLVAQASAELARQQVHSGVLDYAENINPTIDSGVSYIKGQIQTPHTTWYSLWNDNVGLTETACLINGYKVNLRGHGSFETGIINKITLPAPPTYGDRDDIVFLEAWFPQVGQKGVMQWRIRTVAGVDFKLFPNGLDTPNDASPAGSYPMPQGGNTSPLSSAIAWDTKNFLSPSTRKAFNMSINEDNGLFTAGDGSQTSKDTLKTIDGYVYAIPLFRVKRRNSGGYRADNVNGARDYITINHDRTSSIPGGQATLTNVTNYDQIAVGDVLKNSANDEIYKVVSKDGSNTLTVINVYNSNIGAGTGVTGYYVKSDRPDGLYSNIINANDIIDLRHKVSMTGVNYQSLLESSMDSLLRGTLTTKDTKTTVNETYGLQRAPIGVTQDLQSVRVKRADGTSIDLKNLLGVDGGCESIVPFNTSGTVSLSAGRMRSGNNSIKFTAVGSQGPYAYKDYKYVLDPTKQYIVAGWVFIESITSGLPRISLCSYGSNVSVYDADPNINTVGSWQFIYRKIPVGNTLSGGFRMFLGLATGGANCVVYFDEIRLYELSSADYSAIGTTYTTGAQIDQFIPHVDSLPNIAENLLPPFTDWNVNFATLVDPYTMTQNGVGGAYQDNNVTIPVIPNQIVTLRRATVDGRYFVRYYDTNNTDIGSPILFNHGSGLSLSFTIPSNAVKATFYIDNSTLTGVFTFKNVQLVKGLDPHPFVPYGRWFIPANYQGYNSHHGNNSLIHYDGVNGTQFLSNRSTFSDALTVDTRSDIVKALRTPQGHIKVTQATEGVWAIGDTIKIRNDYGFVVGQGVKVVRVTGINVTTKEFTVDDISSFNQADTILFQDPTLASVNNTTYYVAVTNLANRTIKITTDSGLTLPINPIEAHIGYLLLETTSSSLPTVTAAGIAGTWTWLGTKEVTYTITTAPTATTTDIKIDYSAVFPPGKGFTNVATNVLDAYVNGQRNVSGATVSAKANFAGKAMGSFDTIPHIAKHNTLTSNTGVLVPSSPTWGEYGASSYINVGSLDGTVPSHYVTVNGALAQNMFSFDLIRLMEDKYGEGFFADCVDTAAKVAKLKTFVTRLQVNWWGYGSGPTGNKASMSMWNSQAPQWTSPSDWGSNGSHNSGTPSKLTQIATTSNPAPYYAPTNFIDTNGFFHALVYAEASNGSIPSTINTDYVELEVTVTTAETGYTVLQPENPFPTMSENLLMQNQAFPIDTYGFTYVDGGAGVTFDSPGTLAVVFTPDASKRFAVGFIPVKNNTLYTFSYDVDTVTGGALDSYPWGQQTNINLIQSTNIIPLGFKGRMSTTFNSGANNQVMFIIESRGADGITKTAKLSHFKFQEGAAVNPSWTPGRKNATHLNYLGKNMGSTFDNPHRALYTTSNNTNISPSAFTVEHSQLTYDNISKQDGVILPFTAGTPSQHPMTLYEFDLSYLGMSLSQLKAAVRGLTLKWVGYGSGDNGGVLSYGVSTKVWDDANQVWVGGVGGWINAATTPFPINNGIATSFPTSNFITKNQKIYVVAHTYFPASSTNPAVLYTDYVSFRVQLADYVDYVKSNIVKVRPETKEVKLQFPARSHRNLGGGANSDVVSVNYQHVPYQGTASGAKTVKVLAKSNGFMVHSMGTGNVAPTAFTPYVGMASRLPLNEATWKLTSESFDDSYGGGYMPIPNVLRQNIPVTNHYYGHSAAVSFENGIAGSSAVFSQGVKSVQGNYSADSSLPLISRNGATNFYAISAVLPKAATTQSITYYIVIDNGELYLAVVTMINVSQRLIINGHTWDFFKIPGRPLLKGV